MKHPSLRSSGVSFASSKELLDHLKEVHAMKHNGEVPSIPPPVHPNDPRASLYANVQGEDGKMFRCALVACQRTWKVGTARVRIDLPIPIDQPLCLFVNRTPTVCNTTPSPR